MGDHTLGFLRTPPKGTVRTGNSSLGRGWWLLVTRRVNPRCHMRAIEITTVTVRNWAYGVAGALRAPWTATRTVRRICWQLRPYRILARRLKRPFAEAHYCGTNSVPLDRGHIHVGHVIEVPSWVQQRVLHRAPPTSAQGSRRRAFSGSAGRRGGQSARVIQRCRYGRWSRGVTEPAAPVWTSGMAFRRRRRWDEEFARGLLSGPARRILKSTPDQFWTGTVDC